MKPFERSELPTPSFLGSERFLAFIQSIRDELIPRSGPATSVQGELVRANDHLGGELYRNGLGNYYCEGESPETNRYGQMLCFMLDTLIENANGSVSAEDVAFFVETRQRLPTDYELALLQRKEEQGEEEITAEELARIETLSPAGVPWDSLLERSLGCLANWCVANPKLIDRRGQSVEVKGVKELGKKAEAKPVCPICNGKGFIPQEKESDFPKVCRSCQ